jgi:hypothetical protein
MASQGYLQYYHILKVSPLTSITNNNGCLKEEIEPTVQEAEK